MGKWQFKTFAPRIQEEGQNLENWSILERIVLSDMKFLLWWRNYTKQLTYQQTKMIISNTSVITSSFWNLNGCRHTIIVEHLLSPGNGVRASLMDVLPNFWMAAMFQVTKKIQHCMTTLKQKISLIRALLKHHTLLSQNSCK